MISSLPIPPTAAATAKYLIDAPAQPWKAAERALACRRALAEWERRTPVPAHTAQSFEAVRALHGERHLAIDAGCGTGRSTRVLAKALGGVNIVGVDRSAVRLLKGRNALLDHRATHEDVTPPNAHVVRGDLEHFWRLASSDGWRLSYQFFFYPNPYPARGDLKRRLYGRPAFPHVVRLGGRVEVRGSWAAYLEEFRAAYAALAPGVRASKVHLLSEVGGVLPQPISNFEAKFLAADTPLYRLVIEARSAEKRHHCPLAADDDNSLAFV